ncbi:TPA: phage tail tape measure protein [Clostridium sporogenes]
MSGTLETVQSNMGSFNERISNMVERAAPIGENLSKIGPVVEGMGERILNLNDPLITIGKNGVKASNDFGNSMAKLSSIVDTTQVPIGSLREDILKLSNDTGIASTKIADDVYNAILAGQKTGDAVNFVRNSTNLAKAGFADSNDTLSVLSNTMNAYKMKAEDATKVSDMLIATQNEGKIAVSELSSVMGDIVPTAASANVGFNQLCAGYALMNKNGIRAADSTNYMKSMLNEMSKTGSTADKVIRSVSGKSFGQLMKEGKSVSDILEMMEKHAKNNGKSLKDMFASADAGKAALVLATGSGKDFNDILGKINNSSGATDKALKKIPTSVENFRTKLGTAMVDTGKLVSGIGDMCEKFNKLKERIKEAGGVMNFLRTPGMKVALILTTIALVALLVIRNWDKLSKIFKKVGQELSKFTGISKKEIKKIEDIFKRFGKNIGKHFGKAFNDMKKLLPKLKGLFKSIGDLFNLLKPIIMPIIELIAVVFVARIMYAFARISIIISTAISTISGIISGLISIFKGVIDFVVGVFTGDWNRAWNGIKQIFHGVIEIITSIWDGLVDLLTAPVQAVVDILDSVFKDKVKWIKDAWNGLKNFLKHPIKGTVELAKKGASWVQEKVSGSHATGLQRVPYNGYMAELHEDERILTKQQTRELERGKGSNGININIDKMEVRNDSDIERVAEALARKLNIYQVNLA